MTTPERDPRHCCISARCDGAVRGSPGVPPRAGGVEGARSQRSPERTRQSQGSRSLKGPPEGSPFQPQQPSQNWPRSCSWTERRGGCNLPGRLRSHAAGRCLPVMLGRLDTCSAFLSRPAPRGLSRRPALRFPTVALPRHDHEPGAAQRGDDVAFRQQQAGASWLASPR
jgi:hypothetical protein